MTVHPGWNWTTDHILMVLRHGASNGLEYIYRWKDRLANTLNDPDYASFWSDLKVYEQTASAENLPELSFSLYRQFRETGERQAYELAYFERRGRLAALGLLAAASPSVERLQLLEDLIWSVCSEHTWCLAAHVPEGKEEDAREHIDLFAAETAQTLAEMIIMLSDVLDERVVRVVRAEIECRIFNPLYRKQRIFGWENAEHNWSAVCSSSCGIAALLLLEDEHIRAKAVQQTIHSMNAFLKGYGMDGGCAEGIGYWVYGFGFYTYLAEMLRIFSAGELDMLSDPKTRAIAAFPGNIHLSDGVFVNFSDSRERETIPPGLLSLLSERQQIQFNVELCIPLLTEDPCRRWAHALRNVLWSNPAIYRREGESELPPAPVYLDDLSWGVARGILAAGEQKEMIAAFAVKGGHNAEPHNHHDLGHFIIHGGGENILCDPGSGEYTQAYFAPGRESIFQIGPQGHSVPVIEGTVQHSGRQAEARVLYTKQSTPQGIEIAFDLTSAYPEAPTLARYIRRLSWNGPSGTTEAELLLEDQYQWQQPSGTRNREHLIEKPPSVIEYFMSRIHPVMQEERVQWAGNKAVVTMQYDADLWDAQVEEVETVDHDHQRQIFYRLALSLRQMANEEGISRDHSVQETWCRLKFFIHPK
uniref:heparinase II/III domain-containing protein n=1 Tax=Paenibacillus pabuli TaxID=1472 RepID=UPI00078501C9|nr:heparinase II/III family protein [Paenibacillus pabuli]MEC0125994.1 heparinase II/III family protein [Paenibacillus pabuli]